MPFRLENKATYFLIILLVGLGFLANAQKLPDPMSPPRLVNDFARVLSDNEQALLEDKLRKYNDSTSSELTIVTLKTIGNYDVTQFAFELGEKWGVGKKGKDNGIVILVAVDDRKAAIVTGYGMEGVITDASTYQIRERYMNPNFRKGDFYAGLNEATDAIFKLASGELKAENLKGSGNYKEVNPLAIIVPFLLFIGFVAFIIVLSVKNFKKNHLGGKKNLDLLTILLLMNQANQKKGRSGRHGGFGGFSGGSFGGGSSFGGFGGGSFGGGGSGGSW
jgi:uncharacterized protein